MPRREAAFFCAVGSLLALLSTGCERAAGPPPKDEAGVGEERRPVVSGVLARLVADRTVCAEGELPGLAVVIENNSDRRIYFERGGGKIPVFRHATLWDYDARVKDVEQERRSPGPHPASPFGPSDEGILPGESLRLEVVDRETVKLVLSKPGLHRLVALTSFYISPEERRNLTSNVLEIKIVAKGKAVAPGVPVGETPRVSTDESLRMEELVSETRDRDERARDSAAPADPTLPLASLIGSRWGSVWADLAKHGVSIHDRSEAADGHVEYILRQLQLGFGGVRIMVDAGRIDQVEAWAEQNALAPLFSTVVGTVAPGVAVDEIEEAHGAPVYVEYGFHGLCMKGWKIGDYLVFVTSNNGMFLGPSVGRVFCFHTGSLPPSDRMWSLKHRISLNELAEGKVHIEKWPPRRGGW